MGVAQRLKIAVLDLGDCGKQEVWSYTPGNADLKRL